MNATATSGGEGLSVAPSTPGSPGSSGPDRTASVARATKETAIEVTLAVDGTGATQVSTGLPFFDHMVSQLGKHGGFDLVVRADGDLDVDAHHTVEDVGITLGEVLADALGDKAGVRRFASIAVPLDEALVEVALDLSGRPFLAYGIDFAPDTVPLGTPPFDPQLAEEFWRAFVTAAGITLHVHLRSGKNTHHILEASFKGVARALRDAVRREGGGIPSTKGTL
jgi:imidazoleglycerol-phosphate dehydratase